MLKPSEMKKYLLHEESIIRRFATSYLSDGQIYDEDIMPLLLKAYRMEKELTFRSNIAAHMKDFPQNEDTIIALNRLARNVARDRLHFEKAISKADLELILNSKEKFNFQYEDFSHHLKYRIELRKMDTNEIWKSILEMCYEANEDYEKFVYEEACMLSMELCSREDVPIDEIHKWFEKYNYNDPFYKEIFMCLWAGELGLKEYSDIIIKSLGFDWDYINEESMYALIKIGTPYIAKKIGDIFYKENETFQLFASDTLGYMKIEESEDILISLFKRAEKEYIKTKLIFALCNLASPHAIELGTPLLPDKYDTGFDSLEEKLYIVATLNGIEHPQLEKWKKIAKENDEIYINTAKEMRELYF